ncbi:MAG: CARDB domain-containing protein [Nitrospirota bacterium]|nr:CARDB domain-containing protein [Nitrospirota bacterium]
MKSLISISFIIVTSLLLFGCGKPDLVVTTLEVTGPSVINAENSVEVPIRVVIRNQGNASADTFKTAIDYTEPKGTFVVAFTVPGQTDIWYPKTSSPLASGGEVTFSGKVTFHPSLHGVTVSLNAIADSCSGDEFMPDYCRVNESNEENNKSTSISLTLP